MHWQLVFAIHGGINWVTTQPNQEEKEMQEDIQDRPWNMYEGHPKKHNPRYE